MPSELNFVIGMRVRDKIMRTLNRHSNLGKEGDGETACMAIPSLLV